jgi:Arylsulfotransferase (ASST)
MTNIAIQKFFRYVRQRLGLILWFIAVLFLAVFGTAGVTAVVVNHAIEHGETLSPSTRAAILGALNFIRASRSAVQQLRGQSDIEFSKSADDQIRWKRIFPAPEDSGYLLFSGVDRNSHRFEIKLLKLSDGKEMARWTPRWNEIYQSPELSKRSLERPPAIALALHPLLMSNGDVVFNTNEFFMRLEYCTSNVSWISSEIAHHSMEHAADGNIWSFSAGHQKLLANEFVNQNMQGDTIIKISPQGKIIENIPFAKVLLDNGMEALLFGAQGLRFQPDPMHLNEVIEAPDTGPYWQKGDLLISARHLSTVFIYRPTTGKIIWSKTGPWMNQHSVQFLDDHRISILDNHVLSAFDTPANAFMTAKDHNRLLVYDFTLDRISEPYAALLDEAMPRTITQGRAQILSDGGMFFEETDNGRIMRFGGGQLMWSLVNDLDNGKIGALGWSRYLTEAELPAPIKANACVFKR